MHWKYEIVYDDEKDEFVIAEVYYKEGKPISYCTADVTGHTLIELEHMLAELTHQAITQKYLTYKDEELK